MTNLSELLPSGGGAKEFSAVASGTLTNGQTVALKADGKVEAVSTSSASMSSGFNVDADEPETTSVVYISNIDRVAVMYMNTNTTYPEAVIGQITGSSISFGTPQVINTSIQSDPVYGIYDENADRLVLFSSYDTYKYVGVVGTVTGGASNTSSWGALQTGGTLSQITKARAAVYMPDVQKCLLIIRENVGNGELKASSSTINPSTNTITWNGLQSIDATNGPGYNNYGVDVTYDSNYGVAIAAYNNGYSTTVKAVTIDVNSLGTTITIGTVKTLSSGQGYWDNVTIDFDSKTGKCGLVGDYAGNLSIFGVYATNSTTLAQGNNGPYGLGGLAAGDPEGYIKSNGNNEFIYAYRYNASGTQKPNYWTLYIDSNNDLMNTSQSTDFGTTGDAGSFGIDYDTTAQKFVIAFHSAGTTDKNQAHLYNFTTSNLSNFIGITSEAIANTATGKVNPQGGVATTTEPTDGETGTAVNFGVGDNADMKAIFDSGSNRVVFGYQSSSTGYAASSVAEINASNNSVSFGSLGIVQVGSSSYNSITYDASADKIVQITTDPSSGNYNGVANVGTVNSGTNGISFSGLVSYTGTTTIGVQDITYDSTNQKTVICWNRSNFGESIVGTISAGAISFPTYPTGVTQWETSQNSISAVNNTFDSNAGSILVAYQLSGVGLKVVAGQISAGSVTWGSALAPASANVSMAEGGSICFDSQNNKVVVPYEDTGTNEGKVVVCTISGTTVTAGSPVNFTSVAKVFGNSIQSTFDSTLNKVIIAYIHDDDSYLRIVTGTVSGTSMTFDTPIVVTTAGVTASSVALAYDSNANRALVGYKSSTTFGAVYVSTGTENPLTIDATYYIQNNGNITRTATGNTKIGKSISTTQLLLDGAS